jgi:hypothetical protein
VGLPTVVVLECKVDDAVVVSTMVADVLDATGAVVDDDDVVVVAAALPLVASPVAGCWLVACLVTIHIYTCKR